MTPTIHVMASSEDELEAYRGDAPDGVRVAWVDSNASLEDQAAQIAGAVALIAPSYPIPRELVEAAGSLRLVQVTGAGTDRMNLGELTSLGVKVANHGGGKADAVAEHTIALMLSVYRKLHLLFPSVRAGGWGRDIERDMPYTSHELTGKTVGIVGLGYIGKEVARRLQGWKCDLLYYDVVAAPPAMEREWGLRRAALDELLRSSDVVALLVPLMDSTRRMIGERELGLMKPSAILINTCRGPVVDEPALVNALRDRTIMAAGLDVTDPEPPDPGNPLLRMDNVVITPHRSSAVPEAGEKSRAFAVQNAARVAMGEEPLSVVPGRRATDRVGCSAWSSLVREKLSRLPSRPSGG